MTYYSPSPNLTRLGRGAVYFDRQDANGALTGSAHLGNVDNFGLGITTESLTMKNYLQQTAANYNEVAVSTDIAIELSGFEFSKEVQALTFLGTLANYTQAASTASGEVLAPATATDLAGRYLFTAKKNISSVVVEQGATTHVVDVDYEIIDAVRGIIRVIPGGAIAPGTAVTADYSYAAITGTTMPTVKGGVVSAIKGILRFAANNTTGPNDDVIIYNASLAPNGTVGFISDEFGKWTLTGKCLDDSIGAYGGSASDPYFLITRVSGG
jgi:hypothetical protein